MGTAITGTQMRTPKASVVTELPDKGVSNKIYYVPNGTTGDNKYDEYIWIKDAEHPNGYFEKVGQKDIDLNINNLPIKENISGTEKIVISDNDENKGIEISKVKEYATEGVATTEDLYNFIPNLRESWLDYKDDTYFPYCFNNTALAKIPFYHLCDTILTSNNDMAVVREYYSLDDAHPAYFPRGIKLANKREWTDIYYDEHKNEIIVNSTTHFPRLDVDSIQSNIVGTTKSSVYNAVGSITEVYNKTEVDENLKTKVDKVDGKNLSTNDFTNSYKTGLENLLTYAKDLGNYDTEENALNALKDISICGNKDIVHVHLTYGDYATITMFQSIENDYCRQIIFNKSKVFQRAIYFTDSNRTTINYVEDWSFLFGDRLMWDEINHKYVLSQFGNKFNTNVTDAIPMVSSTIDGLMSKDDKVKLEDLNSWNYIGILSSWNGIAKLTTESTEADILNALTITPLRGNKINTKTELFKVLDQCAINKKFLKESSTNAHVFVEHIGSCYVIQILGNKAAILNGNLVGTPVLRHITISANSNEALTVRKNPFEIKLEDINKKVANLETQVKDLTDRITALETK